MDNKEWTYSDIFKAAGLLALVIFVVLVANDVGDALLFLSGCFLGAFYFAAHKLAVDAGEIRGE